MSQNKTESEKQKTLEESLKQWIQVNGTANCITATAFKHHFRCEVCSFTGLAGSIETLQQHVAKPTHLDKLKKFFGRSTRPKYSNTVLKSIQETESGQCTRLNGTDLVQPSSSNVILTENGDTSQKQSTNKLNENGLNTNKSDEKGLSINKSDENDLSTNKSDENGLSTNKSDENGLSTNKSDENGLGTNKSDENGLSTTGVVKENKPNKLEESKKPLIFDVRPDPENSPWMFIRWEGETNFYKIRSTKIIEKWPQLVIKFYEKRRQPPGSGHFLWEYGPNRKLLRLHVEKIQCVEKRRGEFFYGLKWRDSDEMCFVHFRDAIKLWPQEIITLYEEQTKLMNYQESEITGEIDVTRIMEGFEPQEIVKVGFSPQKEKVYQIKWKDSIETVVRATETNKKFPKIVIAFYQPYLRFPDD